MIYLVLTEGRLKMKLGDTIRSLREVRLMTQKELAKQLSLSPSTVGMYEQNRRMPDIDTLITISHIFNVSIDYLLGIDPLREIDIINFQRDDSEIAFNFKHKIRELLVDLKISKEDFMQKTGFDQTISDAYLYGNRMPTIKDLITITDALNVSLDYLFDKTQRKQISSEGESLLQAFDQCNGECQQYLIAKAHVLSVEGIAAVTASEYGKYIDQEKKSHPLNGTEGTGI